MFTLNLNHSIVYIPAESDRLRHGSDFLEVIAHSDTQGRHDYKIAAMVKTITYAVEPRLYLSDLRFILLLVLGLMTAMADFLLFGRQRKSADHQT